MTVDGMSVDNNIFTNNITKTGPFNLVIPEHHYVNENAKHVAIVNPKSIGAFRAVAGEISSS